MQLASRAFMQKIADLVRGTCALEQPSVLLTAQLHLCVYLTCVDFKCRRSRITAQSGVMVQL